VCVSVKLTETVTKPLDTIDDTLAALEHITGLDQRNLGQRGATGFATPQPILDGAQQHASKMTKYFAYGVSSTAA
jgi:hypothetical protein